MTLVSWLVFLQLLVQPLITWWLAFHVFTMDPLWAAGALVQSALPTGALVFVLAQQYGIYVQRSTAAIMASTVLSLVTLSALFVYFGIGDGCYCRIPPLGARPLPWIPYRARFPSLVLDDGLV